MTHKTEKQSTVIWLEIKNPSKIKPAQIENIRKVEIKNNRVVSTEILNAFSAMAPQKEKKNFSFVNAIIKEAFYDNATAILLTTSDVRFNSNPLVALLSLSETDEKFGFVVPKSKFVLPDTSRINLQLARTGHRNQESLDLVQKHFSEIELRPFCDDGMALISRSVFDCVGGLDPESPNLARALLDLSARANRVGFLTATCKTVTASVGKSEETIENLAEARGASFPNYIEPLRQRAQMLAESLITAAQIARDHSKQNIFDLTAATSIKNGTSETISNLLEGLKTNPALNQSTFLVRPETLSNWDKEETEAFEFSTQFPKIIYPLGIRIGQPFSFDELALLDSCSVKNVFLVHDTIAWDCFQLRSPQLDECFEFIAEYSDGLVFVSEQSRDIFLKRFGLRRQIPLLVNHHSLSADDYPLPPKTKSNEDYILIFGNALDHKNLQSSIEVLYRSFPEEKLIVLGLQKTNLAGVKCIPSGSLSDEEVGRLFANARLIIYPSLYEGFGFPLVRALLNHKDVVAYDLKVYREITSQMGAQSAQVQFYKSQEELSSVVWQLLNKERRNQNTQTKRKVIDWNNTKSSAALIDFLSHIRETSNTENLIRRKRWFLNRGIRNHSFWRVSIRHPESHLIDL